MSEASAGTDGTDRSAERWTGGADAAPGRLTAFASVGAALVPALLAGVDPTATAVGLASLAVLTWGLRRRSRVAVTVGAVGLFGECLLAGIAGVGAGSILASGAGVVLAWTFGHASVDLRATVGAGPTRDHELAHVAGTTAIVGGVGAAVWLLSTIDAGDPPPAAVALLVAGGVALLAALRR